MGAIQAVRRRLSLTSPEVLVARSTRAATWPSLHAARISASLACSAGESSFTGVGRRGGRLAVLTERETAGGVREAMAVPASRGSRDEWPNNG